MKLQEYRITSGIMNSKELKHVTVLEEAHNLLKRTSTEQATESSNLLGKSVEMLANAIAEMRTYGEGFIIADQSPGLLDMSVIRNTNTKIILRLPDQGDRELVGKSIGLNDDQIVELSKLQTGVAAICQNDWIQAVLCMVEEYPDPKKKYEYKDNNNDDNTGLDELTKNITEYLFSGVVKDLPPNNIDDLRREILQSTLATGIKTRIVDIIDKGVLPKKINEVFDIITGLYTYSEKTVEIAFKNQPIGPVTYEWARMFRDGVCPHMDDLKLDKGIQKIIMHCLIREASHQNRLLYEQWNDLTHRSVKNA